MSEFIPLSSIEKENDVSWYKSFAAGVASGILKIPEGVVSLAAELIDLGADTDTAASVEEFFDKLNPFEEVAEQRAIGKLTESLIQIGVPGGIGAKLANKAARNLTARALGAKRAGMYPNLKGKGIQMSLRKAQELNSKLKVPRYAAIALGGAAGEALVADTEDIGTFGDMFQSGPTQLDREERDGGREDAIRKLMNRVKFGSESLLITPAVYGVGKSAKAVAQRGKELAYSNKSFDRFLNKYIVAPFTPEGNLPKQIFGAEKIKEGLRSKDINRAREIVNSVTRQVDSIFPETQSMFDKSLRGEREKFLKGLNSILFDGDVSKAINPKKVDELLDQMKRSNVPEETRQMLVGGLNNAREEFGNLISILDNNTKGVTLKKARNEISSLFKDRITNWVGSTYRIFEDQGRGISKLFKRYRPTDEAYNGAVAFFREQGATGQAAKEEVDRLLAEVSKIKKPKDLDFNNYIKKTVEGRPGGDFIKGVIDDTNLPPKAIRELFGEISDPRYSIFNAMTNLSSVARTSAYIKDMGARNTIVQSEGKRGFFWATREAAEKAVNSSKTGIKIVETAGKKEGFVQQLPGGGEYSIPLPKYTTEEIAEGIKHINNLGGGLQGFVRGENKEGAEAAASWMYRNLLLFPKGISQLAKTVLSVPTHIRNFVSAFGFAGANGNLFNPLEFQKAFKEGIEVSGLLKLGDNTPAAQEMYRELLELGVVNSQVQIGDLKNLLRDIKFGEQAANVDTMLNPMMSRLKKIGQFFQGKYVAEDDTFKIASYIMEKAKLKKGYSKLKPRQFKEIRKNALKYVNENELIKKYNSAKKTGFKGNYEEFADDFALKKMSSDIVKNTVPNYEFVGSAVRTSRLLPIGNFMSFPSEMIRTSTNIAELGINQMRHSGKTVGSNMLPYVVDEATGQLIKNDNPFYADGLKRIVGLGSFTVGVPVALTEGAKALYDVTEEEMDALRRFVPDWSKNSTLIPVKDEDGELRYIDFSHSNAYDVMARPLRTLLNNIQNGEMNDQQLLSSFASGVGEASSEIMNPFIGESIWTQAMADLTVRGGRTKDGRSLYSDQTSLGDKMSIQFRHLGEALAPSYRQFQRLGQASFGVPDKRGDQLEIGPELAGFMGFRPIKVDPLRSMGFKISQYQTGIRNSRREFTGGYFGLLRGGRIKPNDIIDRFFKSNKARFDVSQNMYNDLNAAKVLGLRRGKLRQEFNDRQISDSNFQNLERGRFEPYFPSEDIEEKFREIARDLGETDVYRKTVPILRKMFRDFRKINLNKSFNLNIENYLEQVIPTPPLPSTPMPNQQVIQSASAMPASGAMNQGLTPTENALLSEEEKQIRLRSRGLA